MAYIEINGMEFFSYHGCMEEEQIIGNRFIVDVIIEADIQLAAETDELSNTLNYQLAYEAISQEMKIKSKLLENIVYRIINRLHNLFPQAKSIEVKVAKLNPPLHGKIASVSVSERKEFL